MGKMIGEMCKNLGDRREEQLKRFKSLEVAVITFCTTHYI